MQVTLTTTDIVAWWGAIVASLVLVWDIYKWASAGPKLRINARANMKTYGIPGTEDNTYVLVDAVNIGDRPTTISVIGLRYYKSLFQLLSRKPELSFIAPNPALTQQLPHVLEPGKQWTGALIQNDELERMAKEGILVCQVFDTWHKNAHEKRVRIDYKLPEQHPDDEER